MAAEIVYAAAKDRGDFGDSPQTQSLRVAIEAGARLYSAPAEWAEWAQTIPPASKKPQSRTNNNDR